MVADRDRSSSSGLPRYVLISESALSSTNYSTELATLVHPIIHYRYADDPPICPQGSKANLLIMDFDSTAMNTPILSSLTPNLAVDNVVVSEAPGAVLGASGSDVGVMSNNYMYVIRTLALSNEKCVCILDCRCALSNHYRFAAEEPASLMAALELFTQR